MRYFKNIQWIMALWLVAIVVLSAFAASAQTINTANNWIEPTQEYHKIRLWQDGIYRITASQTPFEGENVENLRLYRRGQEQAVYVSSSDNVFSGSDFIEFIGHRNDGEDDRNMYKHPISSIQDDDAQPNRNVSLFDDTSAYFLTVSNSTRPSSATYTTVDVFDFIASPAQLTSYPQSTYCRWISRRDEKQFYSYGSGATYHSSTTQNSDYITGEGFIGSILGGNSSKNYDVQTRYPVSNPAEQPQISARSCTYKTADSSAVQTSGAGGSAQYSFKGITCQTLNYIGVQDQLSSSTTGTAIALSVNSAQGSARPAWFEIRYDREFRFDGEAEFNCLWDNPFNTDVRVQLQGTGANGTDQVILYDVANRRRITGLMQGGNAEFVIPKGQNAGLGELWFSTGNQTQLNAQATKQSAANFANYSGASSGAEFIILAPRALAASAARYATYRDTNTVNPRNSRVYFIEDIYDEFGYGSRTPMAVKRFAKVALDNWSIQPEYLFLWGKAREKLKSLQPYHLPTWGYPCSDMEFIANFRLDTADLEPKMAVGRMNVKTDSQGDEYREKVDEYEHTGFEFWMKRAVHMGGGNNAFEQQQIGSFVGDKHKVIYEGAPYGGQVTYYQKSSNAVIDNSVTNDVRDLINDGVGLIQVFGHSSATVFELAIEEASNYSNYSRYPFMIINGCYAGSFATYSETYGESFVMEPNRGSIGLLALSTAGYASQMGEFTSHFYKVAYRDSIGIPIGDVMRESVMRNLVNKPVSQQNPFVKYHTRENNLQCDPALRLYNPDGPDLAIDAAGISFSPENFTSSIDSVEISVITRNEGLVFTDSFDLRVQQNIVSEGKTIDFGYKRFAPIFFQDTLKMMLPVGDEETPGLSTFDVFVDARDTLTEVREDNNRVFLDYLVADELAVPISPKEFAIVNKTQIELVAATYGVTQQSFTYEFEIDTSHKFNSPLKQNSGPISGTSVEGRWSVPFSMTDSTVYYWRVRLLNDEKRWAYSSFKYIDSPKEGWAQSRPPQFFDNPTENVSMNEVSQKWQFAPRQRGVVVQVGPTFFNFKIEGIEGTEPATSNGGIFGKMVYAVINGKTLKSATYFAPTVGNIDIIKDHTQLYKLEDMINQMHEGDYIIVTSRGGMQVDQWSQSTFDAVSEVGITQKVKGYDPNSTFIWMGRKGEPVGSAHEVYTNNSMVTANQIGKQLNATLTSTMPAGEIETVRVGPSSSWESFWWGWKRQQELPGDEVTTEVYGVRKDGTDTLLLSSLEPASENLTGIDADVYPWLKLKADKKDPNNLTAPQLKHWHVHFTPAPEVLIDPTTEQFAFEADTVREGAPMLLQFTVRNISKYDMDSLLYYIQVRNPDNELINILERRGRPLAALSEDTVRFDFKAMNLSGNCQLIATVNPDYDQVECYQFNNIYRRRFHVISDEINPLLDVTFDGKRIMDGDIVSPEPLIEIRADDENEFLLLDDPELFEVYFRNMDDPLTTEIQVGDPRIEYTPASSDENQATLRFRPGSLADGTYELQVQSYDKRMNSSGETRYKIQFEVINQSTITDIVNYPNPFSTNTRFVYTMTGAEQPEVFQINIYTVSGKRVKTVDLLELGEVSVGQHITDYAWDGTDEYGDKLANGLYLYRVNFRMPQGIDLEKRDAQTKQFFKKGWGKMYIMR